MNKIVVVLGVVITIAFLSFQDVNLNTDLIVKCVAASLLVSSLLKGIIECFVLIKDYTKGIYVENSFDHSRKHIIFISITALSAVLFIYWLFTHNTFVHAFEVHLIGENMWIGIGIYGYALWYGYDHLKDERIDHKEKK